jgi:hypothetical protein
MANPAIGVTGTVLFKKETTYGSHVACTKDIGLVQTCTINPDSKVEDRQGVGQAVSIYEKANLVNVKGSIEFELQHGRALEWGIYGGTTTHVQSGASADWTHTLVWANSLPFLSAEVSFTDPNLKTDYTSMMFNSSTISCTVDGILKMRGDMMGNAMTDTTTATTAVVNANAPLGGFEGSLSLGGSNVDYVQSWEVTVNRNTKTIFGMGDRKNKWGASNLANITWKATIGLENVTQIGRLLSTAGTSISTTEPASFAAIFAADNGVTIGSGKRALSLAMAGCQVKDFSVNLTKGDFSLYDISGSGTINTAASCTMVDQIADTSW